MLKIGMVGMGGISRSHRTAWGQIPEAQVAAVCDIRPEKAEEAAQATGGRAYLDFDEMLEKEAIDILDICLPTYLHADFAVKALNRGIHVLSEKPVSLKREDVAKIYAAADKNDRRFMVAQVLRFWREYEVLREAVQSGRYGKLLSGNMTRLGNTPKWSWDNWMRDPQRSGLVPFDLHIHDLDFLIYTFGKPEKVVCHRAKTDVQDYFHVVYEYPGFFIGTEAAWFECDYPFQAAFRFQFERALMEYKGGKLTTYLPSGEVQTLSPEENANVNGINLPATNGYFNEIRYFTDCVLTGKNCDKVQPWELECVLDLIDEINQAG
jgi:predicted dehydrogenase